MLTAAGRIGQAAPDESAGREAVPTVTGVVPNEGPVGGGVPITIAGSGFTGATSVKFGTVDVGAPPAFFVVDDATITVALPAGLAVGAVNVTVTNGDGTSATGSANLFTYYPVPAITALDPTTGPAAGGNTLKITGTDLNASPAVGFGASPPQAPINASPTEIFVVVPAASVAGVTDGSVNVFVATAGGTSNLRTYTYQPAASPPTITSLSPASGPVAGGNTVTINGTNLTGATSVLFGGITRTPQNVSASSLTVTAPAQSGNTSPVSVTVTTPGGTSSAASYAYAAVPTITSLSPSSGTAAGGNTVTINGTDLTGATSVLFGGVTRTPQNVSASSLTVTAPAQSGNTSPVNVTVTTPGGTSGAASYAYIAAPTITSLNPSSGPAAGGNTVTINGANLSGATSVLFGGVTRTPQNVSASSLTVTAPAQSGNTSPVSVTVTTPGGTSGSASYAYLAAATVTPPTLPGGRKNIAYSQAIGLSSGNVSSAILTSGTLPTGLTLSNSGLLSGTPSQLGSFPLTIALTDSSNTQATATYTLSINRELFFAVGNGARFEGVAANEVRTLGLGGAPPGGGVLNYRTGPTGRLVPGSLLDGQTVALGDITGDGVDDIVTGTPESASGGPYVSVYDGVSGKPISELRPYTFPEVQASVRGAFVATGDVTGDGRADVITGPGVGFRGKVKVFDGVTRQEIRAFEAYAASFEGGVAVAAGDVNGDGIADIITGSASASNHVKVFDGATAAQLQSFFAYAAGFAGGVFVAAGDVNGDGYADIITGAGPGGSPHVKVFSGVDQALLHSFFAFSPTFTGGVRVAGGDLNGDGRSEIIAGAGPGGSPLVNVYDGATTNAILSGFAFGSTYTGGVFVAGPSSPAPRLVIEAPAAGAQVSSPLTVSGWAVDPSAVQGNGISKIEVYFKTATSQVLACSAGEFLIARPDVAAVFGGQFVSAGFSCVSTAGLPQEPFTIIAYARSATTSLIISQTTKAVVPPASAKLTLAITGPVQAVAGQNVTYSMKVANTGSAAATGVVVTAPTPPGASVVGFSGCTSSFPSCAMGSAASNSSPSVTVTLKLAPAFTGSLTYSGSVAWTAPNSGNASASIVTPVVPGPSVTKLTPAEGPASGGTLVTIEGTNLSGATKVNFGKTAVTPVPVNGSPNTLRATAPKGAAGNVNVTVTTTVATTTDTATFKYIGVEVTPPNLAFVATRSGNLSSSQTAPQVITASYNGGASGNGSPTFTYTAVPDQSWLKVTSANVSGHFTVAVVPGQLVSSTNPYSGVVTVSASGNGSPTMTTTVPVTLTVTTRPPQPPFGNFDRPIDGSTVSGAIAVSGWALDDIGLDHVEIWRDPVGSESGVSFAGTDPRHGKIRVASPKQVIDARPDIRDQYPDTPNANRAGWGYLMLTNGLPGNGNGTFKLYAFAFDVEGRVTTLGAKTIVVDNANAVVPFGTLDTPVEGEVYTSSFMSFGWALTPLLSCAVSKVEVALDSGPLVLVSYGDARSGIPAGYANSAAGAGHYFVDISNLTPGTHSIGWLVTDTCGNSQGVGSRFFTVGQSSISASDTPLAKGALAPSATTVNEQPVEVRRGLETTLALPAATGARVVTITQGERVEVHLPAIVGETYQGYQVANGTRLGLPAGSTLDAAQGIFYWQPNTAFLGPFDLEFVTSGGSVVQVRAVVGTSVQAVIDTPQPGEVSPSFTVAGWAIEQAAASGTGIDTVHVWAYPDTGEPPLFLGVASYGDDRPDIGALFGDRFSGASFSLAVQDLAPGTYDIVVYPHSAVIGDFQGARVVRVTVP